MLICYDVNAPKKPTNLTINSDLLQKAKQLKINISSVLESALANNVKQKLNDEWIKSNSESISAYNKHIESNGVFGDNVRTF